MNDAFSRMGVRTPIFAFSHCRDVVAAVSKAGGFGVYGAALHSDEQIEIDLRWIEQRLGDTPDDRPTSTAEQSLLAIRSHNFNKLITTRTMQ